MQASPNFAATRPGPPSQIDVAVQALGSGLASIVVTQNVNSSAGVPTFSHRQHGTPHGHRYKALPVSHNLHSRRSCTGQSQAGTLERMLKKAYHKPSLRRLGL